MVDLYTADKFLNWGNTIRIGAAPKNSFGLGSTVLFASFCFRLCTMVLCAVVISIQPLFARSVSSQHKPAVPQTMFLSSPKSANKIVLSSMVRFFGDKGWAKVLVQTATGKLIPIFEQDGHPPDTAYQPGDWSPDGRYFVVFRVINIRFPTNKQDMGLIIDVKTAKSVELSSSISPTFNHTSYEWVKGKPHSIELTDGETKEHAEPSN